MALTAVMMPVLECAGYQPPDRDSFEQYRQDGTLDERMGRVETLQPYRLSDALRDRAVYKAERASMEASGLTYAQMHALLGGPSFAFPYASAAELPSTGTVKTLTIMVDFKDYRAASVLPGVTHANVASVIYGDGDAAFAPMESARNYYRRASEQKLVLDGNVLGWHSLPGKRVAYEPAKASPALPAAQRRQQQQVNDNRALFSLISETLGAYDAAHDFAQYDNDHDGDIDLVTILYAGPHSGWGSFWWAYRWELFVPEAATRRFDGKRVKQFVFQFVDTRGPGKRFDPTTIIHEIGHSFGLADYYDYDADAGAPGGVGGLDMMDANLGNHNAFSRWLLDWIKPSSVRFEAPASRTLLASGAQAQGNKALAIFPGVQESDAPSGEMFIVENRHKVGNDAGLPGSGLLIWHVDASVNGDGTDFRNDNSFSDPKLIRLVRADSDVDFRDGEPAGAGTFFGASAAFSPTSRPSSRAYSGADTGVVIDQVGAIGESTNVRIGFLTAVAAAPEPAPAPPTGADDVAATAELDALEALDREYARATPTELAQAWQTQRAAGAPDTPVESARATLLLGRWAQKDGEAATEAIVALPGDDPLRLASLPLALESWARNAPVEAAQWYLADANAALRAALGSAERTRFAQHAFEGLYRADGAAAIAGITKLVSTAEIMAAVYGMVEASERLGVPPERLDTQLRGTGSDVARAQFQILEAQRSAEEMIRDRKLRAQFLDQLQRMEDR